MRKLIITLTLLAAAQVAHAGGFVVKPGQVVCFSEEALLEQSQNSDKLAKGCGVTTRAIPVVVLKMALLNPTKVKTVDGGTLLWVSFGALEQLP